MAFDDHKKFIVVLSCTLSFIPLLFLMPGVFDTYPNRYGVIVGIAPMALFLASSATCKPWELMFFVSGLLLITFGVMFFASGEAITSLAKSAHEGKRINDNELKFMVEGMSLWLYSLPIISIGIGINLVSTYLSSSQPPA